MCLTVGEKVGYGLGDTAANLVWRTLMVFLPFFYTDVFGLSAAVVGTLLLVCRFWDGLTDLGMGLIADRTRTRWGRYRPWILATAVPLGITTILTFTTPDLSDTGKLVYASLTYSALIVVYTAINTPYSALMGVMSPDPLERTSLASYRLFFAFLGGLVTQGFSLFLVDRLGRGDDLRGYQRTMTLFAGLAVVLFLVTFATTRERVQASPREASSVRDDLQDLLRNRPWLVLFFFGILFVAYTTLKYGALLYYFTYAVGDEGQATIFMVAGLVAAMAGATTAKPLAARWGKQTVVSALLTGCVVVSALFSFCPPSALAGVFALGTLGEMLAAPVAVLYFSMLADAADYSEWRTGRRATALVFSAGSVGRKVGTGIGGAVTGWTLMACGYVPNVAQSGEALLGIRLLMGAFPAGVALGLLALFRLYPIDTTLLGRVQRELGAQRSPIRDP